MAESELEETMRGFATKWFPEGYELTQDPDSPTAWSADELTGAKRTLLFFVEIVGGIDG